MIGSNHCKKVTRVLNKVGFSESIKIVNTLQGSIWRARNKNQSATKTSVIKVTDQYLHKNAISSVINNKTYQIKEDILLEQSILKYLTQQDNCPKSIVKFQRFFKSKTAYYLVMEDGGSSLFDFVVNAHQFIKSKQFEICNWEQVVKIIFKQMVECIDYIHSKNVCHFDISLENFLVNNIDVVVQECDNITKLTMVTDNLQIKLCDFGLAELFTKSDCKSSKICGKQNYKSPEVVSRKKGFDAKKNDIWCVGICLFMMVTGSCLWSAACVDDPVFKHITTGCLDTILKEWGILNLIDADLMALFQSIFQYESCRIDLNGIKQHQWMKKVKKVN